MNDREPRPSPTVPARAEVVRRRRRWLWAVPIVVTLVPIVAATMSPGWWRDRLEVGPTAPERAEALERGLVAIATRIADGADARTDSGFDAREWAVRIDEAQLNDWLAVRLPAWSAHRGESMAPSVRVRARDGRLDLAARAAGAPVTISARLRLETKDGALRVVADAGAVGRVPVPGRAVRAMISSATTAMETGIPTDGRGWSSFGPIDLGDGRQVEFLDVEVRRGEIRLRAATTSRGSSSRRTSSRRKMVRESSRPWHRDPPTRR